MTNNQKIAWSGSDEHGYTGNVDGVALYKVRIVLHPPAEPREKPRRFYLTRRLEPRSYEGVGDTSHTLDEAKADCESDFRNGGRAALYKILGHALLVVEALGYCVSKLETTKRKDRVSKPTLDDALAVVKAAGFRVSRASKPKIPKRKNQVGPTYAAEFSDGTSVRMSTFGSAKELDWGRGERLARLAWASRHKVPLDLNSAELAKMAPPISACRFEQDGKVLAERLAGANHGV